MAKFTFIRIPQLRRDEAVAHQVLRLCDALEEDDDVQNVYSNLDIPTNCWPDCRPEKVLLPTNARQGAAPPH